MAYQRLIWVDSLKGWLIILVVLGHAIQKTIGDACEANHLWNIIYSFHMAAFMAVSGYVAFRTDTKWGGQFVCQTIWRRFRQLLVPFVLWTVASQLMGGSVDVEKFGLYLLYPDKGLWFLWVLFFINVFFFAGSFLAEKIKTRQEVVIVGICIVLVTVMVLFEVRVLGFQFIAYYFLFYSIGYFFHKYEYKVMSSSVLLMTLLGICWAVLAWFWNMHELPAFLNEQPLPATITQYAYRFITAAIAIYLLLNLSPRVLNSSLLWNCSFVKLGNISLGIYAVHFMFLGMWVIFFRQVGLSDEGVIAGTFVMVLVMTWLIVWLMSKWKVTSTWLLGKI